jgi:hypothetical protein
MSKSPLANRAQRSLLEEGKTGPGSVRTGFLPGVAPP